MASQAPLAIAAALLTSLGSPWVAAQTHSDCLAGQPGYVVGEFVYESAPFPSCHAATLEETPSGIIAAWFGGTHERHQDVGIWVARREAGQWTAPVEVANGVLSDQQRMPTWNPVLFQPRDGPLLLFYKVGPTPKDWWGMVISSADDGKTWSQPRRLPKEILGPIKNKPIQLDNGDILSPSSHESDAAGWRVHFERSTDLGKTWEKTPAVNDGTKIRAIQPSLLVHGNQKLQALGRTRRQGIFQVWSSDNGKTWGEMSLTSLPNPSSGTDAVTLADGRHLLVYNHNPNYKGRSPLNVALSEDGVHWQAALVLEDEPKHQYSYPCVIQSKEGRVHIAYTWRREFIKYVVIDPSYLKLTPLTGAAWPEPSSEPSSERLPGAP